MSSSRKIAGEKRSEDWKMGVGVGIGVVTRRAAIHMYIHCAPLVHAQK
jgi:hypothetical protein